MGLQREVYGRCRQVDLVVSVYNRADDGICRCGMRGYDADVAAHDFKVGKVALQCAVFAGNKAFGTNSDENLLVFNVGYVHNGILADVKYTIFYAAVKYVNGGRTKELCNEQVGGIVVNFLGNYYEYFDWMFGSYRGYCFD